MAEEVIVVLTTWPDAEAARAAVTTLVEERLAACGNVTPAVESIYRWEGKIERSTEAQVFLKSTIGKYSRLESRICQLHPYKVPEVLCLRIQDGLPSYLRWVEASCLP